MYDIGVMLGALVPTLVVSRIALLCLIKWNGGTTRLVVCNAASLVICVLVVSGSGSPISADVSAVVIYGVPQLVWLVFDLTRWKIAIARAAQPSKPA